MLYSPKDTVFSNQQFVGGNAVSRKRVLDSIITAINRERGVHATNEAELLAAEENRRLIEEDADKRAKMAEQAGITQAATTVGETGLLLYGKDMKDWAGNLFRPDTSPAQGAIQNIGGTPTKAYPAMNAGEAIAPEIAPKAVQGAAEIMTPAANATTPYITTQTSSVPTSATNVSPINYMAGNAPSEVTQVGTVAGEATKGAVSGAQTTAGGFTEGLSLGGSVVGPGLAGAAAPGLVNIIRPTATENVGRIATLGLTKDENVKRGVGGAVVGGTAGAITGGFASGAAATSWSGPGAIVGGVVGALGGALSSLLGKKDGGCIIVTACTDRNSYEVEVARQYRNSYLTRCQLRGYYVIAEKLVPKIENNKSMREFTKKYLVDNLVNYGEYKLGLRERPKVVSYIVSKIFLGVIRIAGIIVPRFERSNGEIY